MLIHLAKLALSVCLWTRCLWVRIPLQSLRDFYSWYVLHIWCTCIYVSACPYILGWSCRSSGHRCSVKKVVLRNFAKFTEKHLWQGFFFNKFADPRPETLFKKRPWHRCFPVSFAKFLRAPSFTEHIWATASRAAYMGMKRKCFPA